MSWSAASGGVRNLQSLDQRKRESEREMWLRWEAQLSGSGVLRSFRPTQRLTGGATRRGAYSRVRSVTKREQASSKQAVDPKRYSRGGCAASRPTEQVEFQLGDRGLFEYLQWWQHQTAICVSFLKVGWLSLEP